VDVDGDRGQDPSAKVRQQVIEKSHVDPKLRRSRISLRSNDMPTVRPSPAAVEGAGKVTVAPILAGLELPHVCRGII
jgi:hypothetical protein